MPAFRIISALLCPLAAVAAGHAPPPHESVSETLEIAKVVADFRVGFSLLTTTERQYVAYYDENRRMTVAARALDSREWTYQPLPSHVGWDSHNSVTMAIDAAGHLHVSGNMHVDPLVYFRTETAGDITTLRPATMTGKLEERVTYPRFLTDHKGRLVFTYRHGGSGNGVNFYNVYDTGTRSWSRLLDAPLFDGEGLRNAYPAGPTRGPDGWFHVHWVWRHTPDCATNHHLSYARSRDLVHWESVFGEPVELPVRFDQRELVVDPIPSGGGIINGGHRMIFDAARRPLIAYHKSDAAGNMQIYIARPRDGSWQTTAITRWERPVPFSGSGSMGFIGIGIREFRELAPGVLGVRFQHKHYGSGLLQIDADTLRPVEHPVPAPPPLPAALRRVESDFPGMQPRHAHDIASCGNEGVRYLLHWESLGANRDRKPPSPLPGPATLRLHRITTAQP